MDPTIRADILAAYGDRPQQSGSDRAAYMMYAEACMAAGKTPLTYAEWVKAGKPAK